jgi:hypothetical protein
LRLCQVFRIFSFTKKGVLYGQKEKVNMEKKSLLLYEKNNNEASKARKELVKRLLKEFTLDEIVWMQNEMDYTDMRMTLKDCPIEKKFDDEIRDLYRLKDMINYGWAFVRDECRKNWHYHDREKEKFFKENPGEIRVAICENEREERKHLNSDNCPHCNKLTRFEKDFRAAYAPIKKRDKEKNAEELQKLREKNDAHKRITCSSKYKYQKVND